MNPDGHPTERRPPRLLVSLAGAAIVGIAVVTAWAIDREIVGARTFEPAAAGAIALWGLVLVVALVRERVGAVIALGAVGLAAPQLVWLCELTGWDAGPLGGDRGPVALALGLGCLLTVVGLFGRRIWAWWLAAAGATLGLATGGLNFFGSLAAPGASTWSSAVIACFSVIALVGLIAPAVRRAFGGEPTAAVWRAADPVIAALRAMIVADLIALPTLLIYAFHQPVIPATVTPALVLAGALAVAVTLTVMRKVIGALLLALAGVGLAALAIVNLQAAVTMPDPTLTIVGYYACFWIPGGLLSLRGGLKVLGRLPRGAAEGDGR